MVKYFGIKTVLNGKSTAIDTSESLGRWLKAWVAIAAGKCIREREVNTER